LISGAAVSAAIHSPPMKFWCTVMRRMSSLMVGTEERLGA
jgi:hypothetical protein